MRGNGSVALCGARYRTCVEVKSESVKYQQVRWLGQIARHWGSIQQVQNAPGEGCLLRVEDGGHCAGSDVPAA